MLVSLYSILLTATITTVVLVTIFWALEYRARSAHERHIKKLFFNEELEQIAVLYTNGEFEIKEIKELP